MSPPRMIIAGQPQHIIVLGSKRSDVFCFEAHIRFIFKLGRQYKHDSGL